MQANRAALYFEASQEDVRVKRSGLVAGLMIAGICLMLWNTKFFKSAPMNLV